MTGPWFGRMQCKTAPFGPSHSFRSPMSPLPNVNLVSSGIWALHIFLTGDNTHTLKKIIRTLIQDTTFFLLNYVKSINLRLYLPTRK